MKNIIKTLQLLSFLFVAVSCVKPEAEMISMNEDIEDAEIIILESSYMKDRNIAAFHGLPGKYKAVFDNPDVRLGISSSHNSQSGGESVLAFCDPKDKSRLDKTQMNKILINGKNVFSPSTKSGDGAIAEMFGEDVSFDLSGMNPSTKGSGKGSVQLYSPAPLRISFPAVPSEGGRYPVCYDQSFTVRWNADTKNKNGVLVVVKWNGAVLFGYDYTSTYVVHSKTFPDNGSAVLPASMFEGIPDTAFCSLILLRGDVENINIDDLDYQVLAETHDMLDFVLVSNIIKLYGRDVPTGPTIKS